MHLTKKTSRRYLKYIILLWLTVFSPAPTLLEMQQENFSRRLKSYKSLQGLSTQIESTKSNDASLENGMLALFNYSTFSFLLKFCFSFEFKMLLFVCKILHFLFRNFNINFRSLKCIKQ